ncbi:homoprotocatechuate degradation operon regulator HpaR [uncultured Thiothrix sp.]|uniref:homoprotocatechuate degradation operon regulator HpaR n=1 Tax=uncultured Thiothrix sp. TaxID=223185 RepID=UPI00262DC795|nr:homoprotocatechuate degradation operon regulator HpaR [uncultured Thiothrix sp.]
MRTFERSLPMSLLKAREAVMKKFIPHLRAHDLSPQQWRVLRALYDDPKGMEMSVLSERCFLLMPSLSRIVQNLEARQLISRRTADHDQRCSIISLDQLGHELVEVMAPESEARYAHITQVFGYGKLELLYELLDELVEKLEEADKSPLGETS